MAVGEANSFFAVLAFAAAVEFSTDPAVFLCSPRVLRVQAKIHF
jgi:hypothetical protein